MADLNAIIPAPAVPANGGSGKAFDLVFAEDDAFAKELGLDALTPENAQPEQPRDTDGKFLAKDTVLADTTLTEQKPEQPAEPEQPEQPAEEPAEEQQKPETQKPPLTKFDVLGDDGQPVELPKVKLRYKADGKVVENDLEKVIHLAQQNAFNARTVQSLNEQYTEASQSLQQLQDTMAQYERHVSRMFQNPEVYDEARAAWLEANSPEKRAERAESAVREVRQQQTAAAEAQRVAEFITGNIMPSLQQLAEQFPNVTEDDILGRFALYLPAYQVNGKVPPANLPKVQQFVETELSDWAAATHEQRAKAITGARQSVQKEQATSQALKRQIGKALAPQGSTAQAPATQPKPIKKASDVFDDPIFGGGSN